MVGTLGRESSAVVARIFVFHKITHDPFNLIEGGHHRVAVLGLPLKNGVKQNIAKARSATKDKGY